MTKQELEDKIEKLHKFKMAADFLKDEYETLKEEIKAVMEENGLDTFEGRNCKVLIQERPTTKLDQKKLEAVLGDLSAYKITKKIKYFYVRSI